MLRIVIVGAMLIAGGACVAVDDDERHGSDCAHCDTHPAPPWPPLRLWGSAPDDLYGVNGSDTLWRSTDRGATWTFTTIPGTPRIGAVSGAGHDEVFAFGTSVFRSTDGGVTWSERPVFAPAVGDALPTRLGTGVFAGAGRLYVTAVERLGWGDELILRSDDGGATWREVWRGDKVRLGGIWADGDDIDVGVGWYGGLHSTDGGVTWSKTPVAAIAGHGRERYAAGQGLLRYSDDGGATWHESRSAPLRYYHFTGLWAAGGGEAWAVGSDGWRGAVFQTVDGGRTWAVAKMGPSLRDIACVFGFASGEVFACDGRRSGRNIIRIR